MTDTAPWHCDGCGARLQWRRTAIVCPTHGELCPLPSYPGESEQQQ